MLTPNHHWSLTPHQQRQLTSNYHKGLTPQNQRSNSDLHKQYTHQNVCFLFYHHHPHHGRYIHHQHHPHRHFTLHHHRPHLQSLRMCDTVIVKYNWIAFLLLVAWTINLTWTHLTLGKYSILFFVSRLPFEILTNLQLLNIFVANFTSNFLSLCLINC